MSNKKKSNKVYAVYENLRVEKGIKRFVVDIFSTRKKASDFIKSKNTRTMLITEYEVK